MSIVQEDGLQYEDVLGRRSEVGAPRQSRSGNSDGGHLRIGYANQSMYDLLIPYGGTDVENNLYINIFSCWSQCIVLPRCGLYLVYVCLMPAAFPIRFSGWYYNGTGVCCHPWVDPVLHRAFARQALSSTTGTWSIQTVAR